MRFRYEDDQEIGQAYFLSPSHTSHTLSIYLNVIAEDVSKISHYRLYREISSKFKIYLFIKI